MRWSILQLRRFCSEVKGNNAIENIDSHWEINGLVGYIDIDKEVYFIILGQSEDWVFTFLKIKNVY